MFLRCTVKQEKEIEQGALSLLTERGVYPSVLSLWNYGTVLTFINMSGITAQSVGFKCVKRKNILENVMTCFVSEAFFRYF